ncbi:hypothetical protein LUZ61_007934 [Rhynchospora tenuis]|uniref:Integrase catalytic domain-containing protein n=1 Tax=Rhynchospora tenuis TaxID=198213 RepID=A0AAD6EX21_9POAL|nr:hypothetical protein LUZ61_007934 [Rhynchospora tenuis]
MRGLKETLPGVLPTWKTPHRQISQGTNPEESPRFVYVNNTLYRRTYDGSWLRCISKLEAEQVMKKIHSGACRYDTPRKIISDNGTAFKNNKVDEFTRKYNIEWRYSSVYNPRANGLVEAFNKTLIKILRKTMGDNQKDWHNKLPEALWAYRITHRTPTQATSYSLVYGTETVLPIEVELPSLRVAMASEIPLNKQIQRRLQELDGMDERRLVAQQNLELYQARMTRAYEKLSRPRAFRKGTFVTPESEKMLEEAQNFVVAESIDDTSYLRE